MRVLDAIDDRAAALGEALLDPGEPVVYWHGGGGQLWLHGGCAGSFVLRLARDAWEIERDAGDGRFTITLRQPGVKVSAS